MASTVFSKLTLLYAFLSLSPSAVNASWRMQANTMITARVDPLVNPGKVSAHVHDYVGGNNFGVTYDYDDMRASSCSSVEISEDKSAYWAPSVYYMGRDGSFRLLRSSYVVYYLHRGSDQKAFPKGFQMIAGSASKNTPDPNDPASQAMNFHCLGPDTETLQFPDQYCPQGVRVQIMFPSCWNGVDVTSANFHDHVSYPTDGKEGNNCPDGFGTRLMTLFLEHVIYMDDIDWYPGSLILAEGDNCGWSSHADFAMGWDVDLLQQAIDQCTDPSANLGACGLLLNSQDSDASSECQPVKYLPLEDVGFYGPVPKLPGDNAQWGCGVAKVSTGTPNTPPLVAPYSVVANGWSEHGCIDEGDPYTNTMTGDKLVDEGMSPQMCVAYCDGKGFSMAGLESSDTCFCANQLDHNGSMNLVDFGKCLDRCAGSYYEWCGGGRNLRVFTKPGNTADAPPYNYLPAGGRLDRVYTADGSSVPVVAPPPSTGTTYTDTTSDGSTSAGSTDTGSGPGTNGSTSPSTDPSSGTQYGPQNPPQCSRRDMLTRKRNLDEADVFLTRRNLQNRHARSYRHK